jgi:transcriptional regulator with XRE-family HTH domain
LRFFIVQDALEKQMRRREKNLAMVTRMAELGITGRDLAKRADVSIGTVTFTLNKRTDPKPETALRLAAALESTPNQFGWRAGE